MKIWKLSLLSAASALCIMGFGLTSGVQAATLVDGSPFSGNDCSGDLGTSPDCEYTLPDGTVTPQIIKYDFNDDGSIADFEVGSTFTDVIDGSEFTFDFGDDGNTGTGTFTYTLGEGDPFLTAVSVFGGNAYNVFIDLASYLSGNQYIDVPFFTPTNASGKPAGLSHITFFDTGACEGEDCGGGGQTPVPIPGALPLLMTGVAGLGYLARRRRVRNT